MIRAFHRDRAFTFSRSAEHSLSVFGGPMESDVEGDAAGAHSLHFLARLSNVHLPAIGALTELPLVFGLRHSGCRLRYRVGPTGSIAIIELEPARPADDFPYADYPALLPFIPLDVEVSGPCSFDRFASLLPNAPPAPVAEIVVAVPPPAGIGTSLWGRWGDLEGVTIFFECDPGARVVSATTVCT